MTQQAPAAVPGRLLIENARITFSKGTFEAGVPTGVTDGKPAYNYKLILAPTHPQIAAIIKEINDAAVRFWQATAPQMLALAKATGKIALRDGNTAVDKKEGKPYQGCAGNLVLSVRSDAARYPRPAVLEGRVEVKERGQSRIYDGCYVNALVNFFAYKTGSIGIGCRQLATQFLRDGEPLGSGAPADLSVFPEIESSAKASEEFGALFGIAAPAGSAGFTI